MIDRWGYRPSLDVGIEVVGDPACPRVTFFARHRPTDLHVPVDSPLFDVELVAYGKSLMTTEACPVCGGRIE